MTRRQTITTSLPKRLLLLILPFLTTTIVCGQTTKKIEYFQLRDVRLLNSPFKHAQDLDLAYLLAMNTDKLLAPYLREAGLPQLQPPYGNWESDGLDGHIGGHYLSALSQMYAATGDIKIKERLDYILATLEKCQEANGNGYIGGVPNGKKIWEEIRNGQINASEFSLNERWVPLYNIHKTYAGLRDAYLLTGSESAKGMLIKMTNWALALVEHLPEDSIQEMLKSEHGGLNEIFADVAAITQNPDHLQLARKFSHRRILEPLLHHQDSLTGLHANTQIPKVLGFKRIADLAGDEQWADAVQYFWNNLVQKRSISIGGNSVSEHFNAPEDFSKMIHSIEGPETCNTYNMLRLTKMLYQTRPHESYLNFYERALYNHILSTQHPDHGGLVYFTQIRPSHYRVYSQPHTSMWCCVGSGMENHAKYGEFIYAYQQDSLYVNLFIPSTVSWKEKDVEIIQENNFPYSAKTKLTINPKKQTTFSLKIRKPSWLSLPPIVTVNGVTMKLNATDELISIERQWKKGDVVQLTLPMNIAVEQLPDNSPYYSFLYGPIVLAARTGTEDLKGLRADESRMGHVANGKQIPISEIPILIANQDSLAMLVTPLVSKPLHFSLNNLYKGSTKLSLELEPFFEIHDSRYILYWPQSTAAQRTQRQEQLAAEEREALHLNQATIDKVVCGEQQPESDHYIQQHSSTTGVQGDVRWRQTTGWFSYQMQNPSSKKSLLYIKYINEQTANATDIFVDDKYIGRLTKNENYGVQSALFEYAESGIKKDIAEIKIRAQGKLNSHKILEVRIVDEEIFTTKL